MEARKREAAKTGRTLDGAYGFSFSIALGLVLFIAGLVVSVNLGGGFGVGLIFGIPLLIAGLAVPLFMMRDIFTGHEIDEACPSCGVPIKTSDSTIRLDCPSCNETVMVRDMHLHRTEGGVSKAKAER